MVWMLPAAGGLMGQFGDLFESLIKRDLQIKDSSRILHEHGGVLDRFDSLLFSAPALYLLYILLGV
jgi:phosphatidate cytidylyltransferase